MASLSVLQILRTIKERNTISRTELQQLTKLSWGTITNTTRDLLNRNLIREEGALKTKAGRKPVCLSINPSSHSLIGVDLAPHIIRCVALNLGGETLWQAQRQYDMSLKPEEVLDLIVELVQEALAQPVMTPRMCLGVGVAAPGAINIKAGVMHFAPQMPGWLNVPLRAYLQSRLGVNVLLEHDPKCLALAERWFGAAAAADDILCINLSNGIGMGILLDGEIYRGAQEMAGEFGHITVDPNGPPCACGDRGCLEALCSISAVVDAVRTQPQKQSDAIKTIFKTRAPSVAELVTAAQQHDLAVCEAFQRMGYYLGIGVANLIDLFNPTLVVLCGPMAQASEFYLPVMDQEVQKHAWKHSSKQTIISTLGQQAIAIGACGIVLQSLFEHDALTVGEGEAAKA